MCWLHMMAGSKEDAETVTAFFEDMMRRGLNDPLLVTSDGAPGIIKAIEICFPRAARQRCLAHRMRNLAAKVCFMDDFEAGIAHLGFPVTHRRAIRTTNLLERLFVEERRANSRPASMPYSRKDDSAVACAGLQGPRAGGLSGAEPGHRGAVVSRSSRTRSAREPS